MDYWDQMGFHLELLQLDLAKDVSCDVVKPVSIHLSVDCNDGAGAL
jgi:hypothetical protein